MNNNSTPTVSVIVVTYNQQQYIEQAVRSVLVQQCSFDFEILLADDASTDNTPAVCKQLAEENPSRIRLFLNSENKGLLANYYDTLFMAKGKYIADCAGDDYWTDTNKLQQQVEMLEANPELTLVYSDWQELDQQSQTVRRHCRACPKFNTLILTKHHSLLLLNQIHFAYILLCSACYRKDTVEKVYGQYPQFFERDRYLIEDFQLTFLLLQQGDFGYLDRETVVYRQTSNSFSNRHSVEKKYDYFFNCMLLRLHLADAFGYTANDLRHFLTVVASDLYRYSFRLKAPEKAKQAAHVLKEVGFKSSFWLKCLCALSSSRAIINSLYPLYLLRKKIKAVF